MNNRYFIRINVGGGGHIPHMETMDWYDNPDMLEYNMNRQLEKTVWKLSDMRGKYMKKLGRKGVDWFKKQVDKDIFYCIIEVLRFNHSFDNSDEFRQWCISNNIDIYDCYNLPGSVEERKALQDQATDYYVDWYDVHMNKIRSGSCVYGEGEDYQRTGKDLGFKPGDHMSYCDCGDYLVVGIPEPYCSLHWHDGYIYAVECSNNFPGDPFDRPEELVKKESDVKDVIAIKIKYSTPNGHIWHDWYIMKCSEYTNPKDVIKQYINEKKIDKEDTVISLEIDGKLYNGEDL